MSHKFRIYFILCLLLATGCFVVSCEKNEVSPVLGEPAFEALDTGTLTQIQTSPDIGWTPSYFQIGGNIFAGLGAIGFPATSGAHKKWYRYDIQENLWQEMRDFPGEKRRARTSFAFQGKGYLVGGRDSYQVLVGGAYQSVYKVFNDFWQYDPQTDEWTEKRPPPFTQLVVDQSDKPLYVMSTSSQLFVIENEKLWEYLPENDDWRSINATLPSGIWKGFNTQANVGYILSTDSTVWEYNPVSNQCRDLIKIKELSCYFVIKDKLYTTGIDPANKDAQDINLKYTCYFWEYDLNTGAKRKLLSIPELNTFRYTGIYPNMLTSDNENGYFALDYRSYSRYMYRFTP